MTPAFAGVHAPDETAGRQKRLRQLAAAFSPEVETLSGQIVVFPVGGLLRLYRSLSDVGSAILAKAHGLCLPAARVGIARHSTVAVQAALSFPGLTIVPAGQEAQYLSPLGLDALPFPERMWQVFERWGIRTLGELAALPEVGLVAQFGPLGGQFRDAARGAIRRPFVPDKPPLLFSESCVLEHPIALVEPLLFLLAHLLDTICAGLQAQSLATDELHLSMRLESRTEHERTHRLPVPTHDRKVLLKLLHLDLVAHPPESPVLALSLLAQPAAPRAWQHGLFTPPAPQPEQLEVTLARLSAVVGPENLGSPVVPDSHQPDAFSLARFVAAPHRPGTAETAAVTLTLRHYRPPLPAGVALMEGRPARVQARNIEGVVVAAAGPWTREGGWWTPRPWQRDEWDVALCNQVLYRIFREHLRRRWFVEGYYD